MMHAAPKQLLRTEHAKGQPAARRQSYQFGLAIVSSPCIASGRPRREAWRGRGGGGEKGKGKKGRGNELRPGRTSMMYCCVWPGRARARARTGDPFEARERGERCAVGGKGVVHRHCRAKVAVWRCGFLGSLGRSSTTVWLRSTAARRGVRGRRGQIARASSPREDERQRCVRDSRPKHVCRTVPPGHVLRSTASERSSSLTLDIAT